MHFDAGRPTIPQPQSEERGAIHIDHIRCKYFSQRAAALPPPSRHHLRYRVSSLLRYYRSSARRRLTNGCSFYLDGRTVTVFISNVLLLIKKIFDSVSLTWRSTKENKVCPSAPVLKLSRLVLFVFALTCEMQAISTALTEPVFFNVIDPRYLKR